MPPHLSLEDLQFVRALESARTLTEVSAALHRTPSALSHRLSSLEGRLGIPVCRRGGGSIELTQAGRAIARAAESVATVLDLAHSELDLLLAGRRRRVRAATECHTCYDWFGEVIASAQSAYPDMQIDVTPEATNDPIGALRRDEVDLVIGLSDGVDEPDLVVEPLFAVEFRAVFSPLKPFAGKTALLPDELVGERIYSLFDTDSELYARVFQNRGIAPRRFEQMAVTEAILGMARAGLGVGIVPAWTWQRSRHDGSLASAALGESGYYRQWYLLMRREDLAQPPLLALTGFLKSHVETVCTQLDAHRLGDHEPGDRDDAQECRPAEPEPPAHDCE